MTMLWLGWRCSSYEHYKSLCVWGIKEWVSFGFACLCELSVKIILCSYKFYELLYVALKYDCLLDLIIVEIFLCVALQDDLSMN